MGKSNKQKLVLLGVLVVVLIGSIFYALHTYRKNLQKLRDSAPTQGIEPSGINNQSPYGRWHPIRKSPGADSEELEDIASHPYLSGYHRPSPARRGVTLHHPSRSAGGYILFCSGHAPVVFLMDRSGRSLYQWEIPFEKVWPEPPDFHVGEEHKQFIRRAHLYPDGDLLCVFEYTGILRIDRHSNIRWVHTRKNHHDIHVDNKGFIYTLGASTLNMPDAYPGFPIQRPIIDNNITILTPRGQLLETISIFDAFYRSPYVEVLAFIKMKHDVFHANSVDTADENVSEKLPFCNPGDILISIKYLNTIAVIDREKKTVKWALTGMWYYQHQAMFLQTGNILLFDNFGGSVSHPFSPPHQSAVIEIDPLTQRVVWSHRGTDRRPFFTHWLGYNQRLDNGNTLITESDQGHIFEVTPDGEKVWEYYNPYRTGDNNELIATVMGARRVDPEVLTFPLETESSPEVSESAAGN